MMWMLNRGFLFLPWMMFLGLAELNLHLVVPRRPAINISEFLSGFNAVKDPLAICTVELLVDVPDSSDTKYLVRVKDGYAGHCFLRLTKAGADTTVCRTFGFYPKLGLLTLVYKGPVKARFVDDAGHAFNARMSKTVSLNCFREVVEWISVEGTKRRYDINDFNCADFALMVFNRVVEGRHLSVGKEKVLGGYMTMTTPNGVYEFIGKRVSRRVEGN